MIASKIDGQGDAVDVGGALGEIFRGVLAEIDGIGVFEQGKGEHSAQLKGEAA